MTALLLTLTALLPTAQAGGVGLVTTGGFRGETVHYYDANDQQYRLGETIANGGTGIEVVLGDRDNRIIGHFRGYWIAETPEFDPAKKATLVPADEIVAAWRDETRHVGMLTVGLEFGILGDPATWQLSAAANMGSGFLTTDHTEFLLVEAGPTITKMVSRDVQLHASAVYALRQDRGFRHGANAYIGARWLFD